MFAAIAITGTLALLGLAWACVAVATKADRHETLLEKKIRERARESRQTGHPPDWHPQAIKNKKKRRAALAYWHETGELPDPKRLRAMRW